MSLFALMFPGEAATIARLERRVGRLSDLAGYDEWADPLLEGVAEQVRAGQHIKAAQLYAKATGCGVGEARLAIAELQARGGER